MTRQQRAEQTRHRLIDAAAAEFGAHGYAGTTLQRVARAAGVTMGALTFHFPSKSALAEAVQQAGAEATRALLRSALEGSGLAEVLGGTLALAQALDSTPSMRAAARLAREGHRGSQDWYASWVPQLRAGLERVWPEQRPGTGLSAAAVTALLGYLLIGVEATAASGGAPPLAVAREPRDALGQLTQALLALTAGGDGGRP